MAVVFRQFCQFWCRRIHTVRPHMPLIKFPKRFPLETLFSAQPSSASQQGSQGTDSKSRTIYVLEETELPEKYRRAAILNEEIAYIERGGPD